MKKTENENVSSFRGNKDVFSLRVKKTCFHLVGMKKFSFRGNENVSSFQWNKNVSLLIGNEIFLHLV